MADIAKIGASFDTSDLLKGKAAIQALVPPAKAAESAVAGVETAMEGAGNAAATVAAPGVKKAASAFAEASGAATSASSAFKQAAAGAQAMGAAGGAAAGRTKQFAADLGDFSSHVGLYRNQLGGVRKDLKLTATEGLNAGRQLADIGVTGLSGMSPLLIAIQQGPQLLDIFQQAAIRTGTTVGTVFKAAAAQAYAAIAPLLPIILAIAAAVGLIAAGFALVTREFDKTNKNVTAGMDLTEKQLERLKKKGVETSITIGDTWNAFFMTIGDRFEKAFDGPLKWLKDTWNATLDLMFKNASTGVKYIAGSFVGAYKAIVAVWKMLPAAFGDIIATAVNANLKVFTFFINKVIAGANKLIAFANDAAAKVGLDLKIGPLGDVDLGQMLNPNAGTAEKAGKVTAAAFLSGISDVGKWQTEFFNDWEKNAQKVARKRLKPLIGDPGATAKAAKDKGSVFDFSPPADLPAGFEDTMKKYEKAWADAAKVRAEYFKDANARLTATKQEFGYIGMSADAVTRLRIENDLLAQAREKNIMLTPETVAGIKDIAGATADYEIATRKAADALDFAKNNTKSFINDLRSGLQQGQSIWQSFGNAVLNVLNRIVDKMLDAAIDNMFDGASGGKGGGFANTLVNFASTLFKNAKGNAFDNGRVAEFAKGDAFTNSVVSSPTMFGMSNGGTGVMGEAGPEAVVPLTRGPDGSLGVQMYGGQGGGGQQVNAPVNVVNNYTLSGAISSADIVALNKAAAEQTTEVVKRNLVAWLDQYGRDGTL